MTEPAQFETVNKAVEAKGVKPAAAEVTWIPTLTVPLSDAKAIAEVSKLTDLLEEHDDVKDIYSNAEFAE